MTIESGKGFWLQKMVLRAYAMVLGLIGLAMLLGGGVLVLDGGSFYYAIAGMLILASAVLLWLYKRAGAWLYGAVLIFTVIWSIWEVGFDPWAQMPRLLMLGVFGVWLLFPWSQRPLQGHFGPAARMPLGATGIIAGGTVASIVLGALSFLLTTDLPPDPRFQTGFGPFPEQEALAYQGNAGADWPFFGGDLGGVRYSSLNQITPENVVHLEKAWEVDVGQMPTTNASPIKIGDTIFTCNNWNGIFALDAKTGEQRWYHDASNGWGGTCRGVSHFKVADGEGLCATRILAGNSTAQLIALDVETGQRCPDFGEDGIVDLSVGMGDVKGDVIGGYYRVTSAPLIIRGKAVVGGWISDNQYWGEPSGVIRAFDAVTGEFAWAWDIGNPGVHTEPPKGQHYTHSTPNSWAPMSADDELGLVYLPTGNAAADLFGGQRRDFDDKFSSSVVALNADTGELVWSFQTLHHDLWDHDVASQPVLVDLPGEDGAVIPALIQPTKQGEVFVLNRVTGEPIYEVTEIPAPQGGGVPEEYLAPTQPRSNALPSFRGPVLREADMWGISPLDQLYCRVRFSQARYEGMQTPPGLTPSIEIPSTFGAINWGSVSVDPVHGVMIANSNLIANYVRLITREEAESFGLKRAGPFADSYEMVRGGAQEGTPYATVRPYWLTALGIPCTAPPYGYISAVDLNTGHLLWTDRFGTSLDSGPFGVGFPFALPMGAPNHGGSLITRSGLVFIGATKDNMFHAYELRTGKLLWRVELPGGGNSAPISYSIDGRQYIVIHAGGSAAIQSRMSTKMVAFTLPN